MVEPRALRITILAFVLAAVAYTATVYVRSPLFRVSGVILLKQILMLVAVLVGLYARVWHIPSLLNRVFSALALAVVVYLIVDGWRVHLFRRHPEALLIDLVAAVVITYHITRPFFKRVLELVRRS